MTNPPEPRIDEPVSEPNPTPIVTGASDTTDHTDVDNASDSQSTAEQAGLKLAEDSDTPVSPPDTNGDHRDRAFEPVESTNGPVGNLEAPDSAELAEQLRSLFAGVDRAMLDTQFLQDVQTIMTQQSGRKFLSGSDTAGNTNDIQASDLTTLQRFKGFTMTGPDGEVTTKVYENGNVVTKFADGMELRFQRGGGADISVEGQPPRSVTREEANRPIATASGDGFKATQNADGTLKIEFTEAQADGATIMTLHPPGPDGLKWTRTIPASGGMPEQTVSAYTDGRKQIDFGQPMSGLDTAVSTNAGEILVAHERPQEEVPANETPAPHEEVPEAETPAPIVLDLQRTTVELLSEPLPSRQLASRYRLTTSLDPGSASGAQADNPLFVRGRGESFLPGSTERPASIPERMASTVPYLLNPHAVFLFGQNPFATDGFGSADPLSQLLRRDRQRSPFDLPQLQPAAPQSEPQWLAAGEAVRQMSEATNTFEAISALQQLSKLADQSNPHAQTAMAATILALVGGEDGLRPMPLS